MTVVTHILATLVALAVGFSLLSWLRWPGMTSRSLFEQLGLSYIVGLWLITLEIFVFGHIGVPASLTTLLLAQLAPAALLAARFVVWKGRPLFRANIDWRGLWRRRGWQWLLIVLIASKLIYVGAMNLSELRRTDDAFTWAISLAKHTYFEQNHTGFTMAYSYPKFPGLALSWFEMCRGQWNEFALNLPYLNYVFFFLLLFYANLRRHTSRSAALIGAYIATAFPLVLNHAVLVGYNDMILGFMLCFTGAYAYRYAKGGQWDDLILAVFFLLAQTTIKKEGFFPYFAFGLYAVLISVIYQRWIKRPLLVWATTLGIIAAGILMLTVLTAVYGGTQLRSGDLDRPSYVVARLQNGGTPISDYLRGRMAPDTRKLVDAWEPGTEVPSDTQSAVIADLNKEIENASFFTAERFKGATLSAETQAMIKSKPTGDARTRLHRRLLEDAYPDAIIERGPPFLHPLVWGHIRPGYHLDVVWRPYLYHFGYYFNNWMVVGPLLVIALLPLIIVFARRVEFVLCVYCFLQVFAYLYLFSVGGVYFALVDGTTVNRSFMQMAPSLLFANVVMIYLLTNKARSET